MNDNFNLEDQVFAAVYLIKNDDKFDLVILHSTDEDDAGLLAMAVALAEVARTDQEYLLEVLDQMSTDVRTLMQLAVDNTLVN